MKPWMLFALHLLLVMAVALESWPASMAVVFTWLLATESAKKLQRRHFPEHGQFMVVDLVNGNVSMPASLEDRPVRIQVQTTDRLLTLTNVDYELEQGMENALRRMRKVGWPVMEREEV